jgi:bifunctional ADP-heptose synthase (sugar kinase/adenylyltransferase)
MRPAPRWNACRRRRRAHVVHRDTVVGTTVKLRVIGRQQQLLRIDFETTPSLDVLASKLADYDRLSPTPISIPSTTARQPAHIAR